MSLPNGFGEFWPDGDFEDGDNPDAIGWVGRLEEQFNGQSEEEQNSLMPNTDWFRYAYFVSKKFITEVGVKAAVDLPPVSPVLDHEAPKTFNTERACKKLGDLIMLNDRIIAVSVDMKNIIENLEPNVHQFFPIRIVQPRSEYPKQFFTMVIGNYRESFKDVTKALARWGDDGPYKFSNVNKKEAATLHFEKSQFGDAHIWRERLFNEEIVLFSDDVVSQIENSNLRTPKIYKAKEIA